MARPDRRHDHSFLRQGSSQQNNPAAHTRQLTRGVRTTERESRKDNTEHGRAGAKRGSYGGGRRGDEGSGGGDRPVQLGRHNQVSGGLQDR
ncbi:unnamed protein product [Ectocarpus sp. 12 AP-2014]